MEDILHSGKDFQHIDRILRQREKETLINKPLLVDVPISPLANERPHRHKPNPYFGVCFSIFMENAGSVQPSRDPVVVREATEWLEDLVNGDSGIADCLSFYAVD